MNYDDLLMFLESMNLRAHARDGRYMPPPHVAKYLSPMQRKSRSDRLSLPWAEYQLLVSLAMGGWSMRYSLVTLLAQIWHLDVGSGTLNRACAFLQKAGLWESTNTYVTSLTSLVRLTDQGRSLMLDAGFTPVESDWERIERLHRGDTSRQIRHTAGICAFAHHARIQYYDVLVCPEVDGPAEPDIFIDDGEDQFYVEVQGRGGEGWRRAQKWHNLYRLQGQTAICTFTPAQAHRYAKEAQIAGVPRGVITDLQTLHTESPESLWTHQWTSRYDGVYPYEAE